MKLFAWLGRFRKKPAPAGKLCCSDCQRAIHRHDRFIITAVVHRDCWDTKLTGQMSLPKGD